MNGASRQDHSRGTSDPAAATLHPDAVRGHPALLLSKPEASTRSAVPQAPRQKRRQPRLGRTTRAPRRQNLCTTIRQHCLNTRLKHSRPSPLLWLCTHAQQTPPSGVRCAQVAACSVAVLCLFHDLLACLHHLNTIRWVLGRQFAQRAASRRLQAGGSSSLRRRK